MILVLFGEVNVLKYFDVPKFRIRPSPGRFLFDKLLVLFGLGILLYLGIYVNYFLLSSTIPKVLNILFIIGIFLLIVLELILCYVKYGNFVYEFYDEKLKLNYSDVHELSYSDMSSISYRVNLFDKMFRTGTITILSRDGKKFKLKYLNNPNQAYLLIQRHVK
ncbi:MAG: PH domain-containing protein [Candidatus Woesearchaeota archaeon]